MDIVVLGAGGVGGYYGGVLARAGHSVRLLARGKHLEAIRERGLEVRAPDGAFTAALFATDDPNALRPAEFVLLTVKSYALPEIAPIAADLGRNGATILPLLNGVGVAEALVKQGVPATSLLGGLTFISAARTAPGVVERYSAFQRIVAGEFDGAASTRVQSLVDAFRAAGVEARVSDRIEVELWQKFVFISAMAAVCGLARAAIGVVRDAPLGPVLIERAVHEASAVARASGIALPADEEFRVIGMINALSGSIKPSLLVDLEQGRPIELDALSGALSRLGSSLGVPTPVHDTVTTALSTSSSTLVHSRPG